LKVNGTAVIRHTKIDGVLALLKGKLSCQKVIVF
jgi:hypothetical protein